MPKVLAWAPVRERLSSQEADRVVDEMRAFKASRIKGSNVVPCSVCADTEPHAMRYQMTECSSRLCLARAKAMAKAATAKAATASAAEDKEPVSKEASRQSPCPWRCKVLRCQRHDLVSIFTAAEHLDGAPDPVTGRARRLPKRHKALAESLAMRGLKPQQILSRLLDGAGSRETPGLRQVQNYVNYYRRTKLHNTDDLEQLEAQIKAGAFCGHEEDVQPFFFSIHADAAGRPHVGDGSDDDPMLVGVSSKALLRRMDCDPETFVLHLDTVSEINQVGYPVLVCGVSDAARRFHLVALFVMSQLEARHYTSALASLQQVFTRVTAKPLLLRYVMGGASDAQFAALADAFRNCSFEYLTCFYHVLSELLAHRGAVSEAKMHRMLTDMYDMHCAKTPGDFIAHKTAAVMRWRADPELAALGEYVFERWLNGRYEAWQCFRSPVGFATTNKTVEQCINVLRQGVTPRRRMLMGVLMARLSECCHSEAVKGTTFATEASASTKLKARARELRRTGHLVQVPALGAADQEPGSGFGGLMMVRSLAVPQSAAVDALDLAAQLQANNERMELDDQPEAGWFVDVRRRTCPCKFFFKYGQCVHLLFALYTRYGSDRPPKRALVNRSQHTRKRAAQEAAISP